MAVSIRPTTEQDIEELASNLLPADRVEIEAMGLEPLAALKRSLGNSLECITFRWNGDLVTVVGVSQVLPLGDINPWMISTPLILQHSRKVMGYSRTILDHWLAQHHYLTNVVDQRHTRAVRWLGWLGASFEPIPAFGPYRRPFFKFSFGAQ
jgi:hypothetical protein